MQTKAVLLSLLFCCLLANGQTMQDGFMQDGGMQGGPARDGVDDPMIASLDERPPTAEELKFFEAEIRPILITNCYGCHSKTANLAKAKLRLDTRDAVRKGGRSGPALIPGDPDSSLLIQAVRYLDVDFQMPPDGKLTGEEIRALEKWVAMGAPDPREEKPVDSAGSPNGVSPGTAHRWSKDDIAQGKNTHWAYRPVVDSKPPTAADPQWANNAIDGFVFAEMAERGLTPAARADPHTLLRRASFDLTGLAPTQDALAAFDSDAAARSPAAAFATAVDAMLASTAFGERWGRHWLDVARYAESSGKESNILYPHAWRYRDYVVQAFNEDKPYDRFLTEQIAGDLLPAADDIERGENLVATGYLAIGTKSHNARGNAQFQMDLADEQLDATTQGMLGLTVACARCHDHKFDPIPQKDYYALAGIFLSTDTRYGTFDAQGNNHPAELIELPAGSKLPLGPKMRPDQRSLLAVANARAETIAAEAQETINAARTARAKGEELPANIQQQVVRARAAQGAAKNLTSLTERFGPDGDPTAKNLVAMGATDRNRAMNARVLDRGELDKPGAAVPRGFVELISRGDEPAIVRGSSGRLELARWIANANNPLTARVWANRVWLHLFGRGLVPTPDNFGMSGQKPTHPELLDHLATRLIADGWSTKKLIREIVLSRAYAMASAFDPKDAEIDPDCNYLWRMTPKRLEAEAIRDSMLAAADILVRKPKLGSPITFAEGAARGAAQERIIGSTNGDGDNNRSIYLPIVRDKVPESLDVFDFAESAYVMGQRDVTNVPTQALFLMNSKEIARICDMFAMRVISAGPKEIDRVNAAFTIALGRKPTASEVAFCRDFLDDFKKATVKDGRNAPPVTERGAAPRDRRDPDAKAKAKAKTDAKANANTKTPRERARAALDATMNPMQAQPMTLTAEQLAYSALCQAIFLSGEFRTVD